LQGRAGLKPEPEGVLGRLQARGTEPSARRPPRPHDLPDPSGEPGEIVAVYDPRRPGRWMGVMVEDAVREGDAVAVGGTPPIPTGLVGQDLDQGMHLIPGLVEGVLV